MRISELSAASGVPLPTIKYYLREGLLPTGRATGRNQADYGAAHVARLRLIRALIDVGGLSVAGAGQVLAALGDPSLHPHDLLGVAHHALAARSEVDRNSDEWRLAREGVTALAASRGWLVTADAPALDQAADALAVFVRAEATDLAPLVDVYVEAAERLGRAEVAAIAAREDPAAMVEGAVLGTVVGEALFNALRRLAQEDASARRFGMTARDMAEHCGEHDPARAAGKSDN
ncbi:MAG: MerR family transcriptional regulator [Actinocrinis sp.]